MGSARAAAGSRELRRLAGDLRIRLAVNHFKRLLLGGTHVPGRAQADAVFDALEEHAWRLAPRHLLANPEFNALKWLGFRLTPRSWENWFASNPRVPKRSRMAALDLAAGAMLRWRRPADKADLVLPDDFYLGAVHGGLLAEMLADTEATAPPLELLWSRARRYRPVSAWHLHLDALELRAFSGDWKGIPASSVVEIAGLRILEELHRLWRPNSGTVYESFSALSGRFWDLSAEEVKTLDQRSRAQGAAVESQTDGDRQPNWLCIAVDTDTPSIHAHRLLFAIGADRTFAQDDRLAAWAMDLATAALAAIALADSQRRLRPNGPSFTDEKIFLVALDVLMLVDSLAVDSESQRAAAHLREYRPELRAAMDATGGDWRSSSASALSDARVAYRREMADLGISGGDLDAFAAHATNGTHRIYKAQVLPW
jgi:hypothetical protein